MATKDHRELKPCPFCGYRHIRTGGRVNIHDPADIWDYNGNPPMLWRAYCRCGAAHDCFDTEEDAIAAWNTRAAVPSDDVVERVARAIAEENYGLHCTEMQIQGVQPAPVEQYLESHTKHYMGEAKAAIAAMQPAIDKARKQIIKLRGYAQHDDDCKVNTDPWAHDNCTCGLSPLLRETEGEE